MPTNFYFNNFSNSQEQLLIEDLCIEAIKIHGIDVYYLPKTYSDYDYLHGESDIGYFGSFHECEMYINTVDGFGGEGDFLSKFGLEVRDQLTMSVARFSFETNVGGPASINRPREGDLLYFPLTGGLFEIKFVEHEPVFYQMGALQFYELRLEKFEYNGERLDTGIEVVDSLESTKSMDIGFGRYLMEENGSQPLNLENGDRIILDGVDELIDTDDAADSENDFFQTQGANFIDFTDRDPFSEGGTF